MHIGINEPSDVQKQYIGKDVFGKVGVFVCMCVCFVLGARSPIKITTDM